MTFSGVFAPIPTPFADDGEIDLAAWRDNIDRWMGTGLHGLVVLGTNGEAPLVDDDEADRLIAAARDRGPSILDDGIAKMRLGLTTAQEVARAIHDGAPPQPSISLAASQEDE